MTRDQSNPTAKEKSDLWRTTPVPDKMPYMRVLVVEDQRKMARFIQQGLGEAGYSVDLAETGQSAELLAAENEYDLVILDVMLPDQNGLDTARHLRNDGFEKPILMGSVLRFEDIEMDLVKRKEKRAGQEMTLTQKEFALLEYFLRNPDRPLTRTSIAEHVWDARFDSDSNVIDVYINMLRKKVDQPFPTKLIHTVVGVGYVLKRQEH